MSTYIDGIAASENIDSSGEKLSIAGMDISSLDKTGSFNWEHKKDVPAQTVGKILKAKKIFKEEDCSDERELMYWKKCGVPFVYVMGELLDEYCESSKHVAGLFKYDHDRQTQNAHDIVGFSIEGAKIEKVGMVITRSIARKCTITESPCNKMAIAEMIPSSENKKDDLSSIFKTELFSEIQLFKSEPAAFGETPKSDIEKHADILGLEPMKKSLPAFGTRPAQLPGTHIGTTSGGHKVMSHMKPAAYGQMSAAHHREAANHHFNAAQKNPSLAQHHTTQMKFHMQAGETQERREKQFPKAHAAKVATAVQHQRVIRKADTAGSSMGSAPGTQTGGAALQGESLEGKTQILLTTKKKKKIDWLARAEEEYSKWDKREQFQSFMAKKMPHLAKGEIDAIGRTLALKKAVEAEETLAKLTKK